MAAFISTLMMVGVVTMPVEIKYFGKKATFLRNGLAVIMIIAYITEKVLKQHEIDAIYKMAEIK